MSGNPKLLIETIPFKFQLEEGKDGTARLVARGQFARVDKATENKRFYRRDLYQREIDKLQEDINNRKVFGELDHPCLTDNDFRVLTVSGWKPFQEIKAGDKVWSRKNGKAVLSTVKEIVDEPYSGPVLHFKGRSIDATFTPAHKFLAVERPDRNHQNEVYVTAQELASDSGRYGHHAIPRTAEYFSEGGETFVIPGVLTPCVGRCKNDVTQDLVIDAKVFAGFMGIYLAEGSCASLSTDTYGVFVSQKTSWSKDYIYQEVLSKFPEEIKWTYDENGGTFYTADARLWEYLSSLGNVYEKHIPEEVKRLSPDDLKELVFWFGVGDGRMVAADSKKNHQLAESGKTFKEVAADRLRQGSVTFTRQDVFTVSKQLIDDLHECVVRSGGSGVVSCIEQKGDREIEGRVIREENRVPLYQLHIAHSKNIWLDPRFLQIEEKQHDGNIYCLKTTGGNFYMEKNGNSFWTGNSDGKTKLTRVSHILTDLHIENNEVVGAAEILDTPNGRILKAIYQAGGQPGVSSRGFGSTKSRSDGIDEVQDDFNLHTFDFVADPATKTAYPGVFTEELEKIPVDGDTSLTLETLNRDFGGLVEEIRRQSAEAQIDQTKEELKKQFAEQLIAAVEQAHENAYQQALDELQELEGSEGLEEHSGARVVSAEPLSVSSNTLSIPTDDDDDDDDQLEALQIKLAETEIELEEMTARAKHAGNRFHAEKCIHEMELDRDKAWEALGDIVEFDELHEINDFLFSHWDELKKDEDVDPEDVDNETEIERLKESLEYAEERAETAEAELKQANRRALEAVEIAENLQVQNYVERKVSGHRYANRIRRLCENVNSMEDVDRVVENFVVDRPYDDDEAERIRARVARGRERFLEEEVSGKGNNTRNGRNNLLTPIGVSIEEFETLSGRKSAS